MSPIRSTTGFLDLPKELRVTIYELAMDSHAGKLEFDGTINLAIFGGGIHNITHHKCIEDRRRYLEGAWNRTGKMPAKARDPPGIVMVNKQLYAEAVHTFYEAILFDIEFAAPNLETIVSSAANSVALACAKHVDLNVQADEDDEGIYDDVASVCHALKQSDNLRDLNIILTGTNRPWVEREQYEYVLKIMRPFQDDDRVTFHLEPASGPGWSKFERTSFQDLENRVSRYTLAHFTYGLSSRRG